MGILKQPGSNAGRGGRRGARHDRRAAEVAAGRHEVEVLFDTTSFITESVDEIKPRARARGGADPLVCWCSWARCRRTSTCCSRVPMSLLGTIA